MRLKLRHVVLALFGIFYNCNEIFIVKSYIYLLFEYSILFKPIFKSSAAASDKKLLFVVTVSLND